MIESVQTPSTPGPQPNNTPGGRVVADLSFSQLGGASWSSWRTQIDLKVSVETGQILAQYQTLL
ncbi:hypothetical protein LMG26411_04916 [Cupriavidus numazuensis]|uniref:Uncharacterized protein n=1 Tax=Cupriavidus numazuensis TaxID=221992 RepID=A0ABN7Q365_9BURK|nr:hypothetical protein LMG26411_04916 [Cupriavidus numazuensis]